MSLTIRCTELAFCSCNKILTGSYTFSKLAMPRIYTLLFFISYCSIVDFTPAPKLFLTNNCKQLINLSTFKQNKKYNFLFSDFLRLRVRLCCKETGQSELNITTLQYFL